MKKNKIKKVKIMYLNSKISKKPQIILGTLLKEKNKCNYIKILRKVSYENLIQTFYVNNKDYIKNISFF